MSNNIIPIGQQINAVSHAMRQRMAASLAGNKAFTSNVSSSYPMLSIRGKEFTLRLPDGRSNTHLGADGFAARSIDVVLVEASQLLSKTYYENGFDPAEFTRPDCWSLDSVKPDPSSPKLQSVTCAICPQNQFGSRITPAGKKAKACSDYRRVVVLLPHQVGSDQATPMVLRVPQSSLKNLKAHGELLDRYGVNVNAAITRLSFTGEAYPQLAFTYVNILTEQQWDWVGQMAASPLVQGMVHTPDFENATSTPMQQTPAHNAGLTPLPVEQAPAFTQLLVPDEEEEADEDGVLPDVVKEVIAAHFPQAGNLPDLKAVPEVQLVELPDGKWYNPVTKQYVEAPAPKVEMPALDPETMELPEGKFFNTRSKAYVTGPEVGAPPVGTAPTAATVPAPAKRTRAKKAAPEAQPQAAAEEVEQPKQQQQAKPAGNGGIKPASAALDDVLREALGDNTTP